MPDPVLELGFNTPFAEQLAFFRQKLNLPTEHWDDIMRAAHDRAFVVAGAMKADLLADLHGSVEKIMAEGKSIGWFRKEFAGIVGKHGWQGWKGEGSPEGFAWRTRVIYQTNLATSYAAGRYAQLTDPELLTLRPYWRYKHADGVANPRLQHVAWNGLTLPHDHPFWQTHFPPNGWGCHCRVVAVSARHYAKAQAAGLAEPPEGWNAIDGNTGDPVGIAKGLGYAPGASLGDELRGLVAGKVEKLPEQIGSDFAKDALAEGPGQVASPISTSVRGAEDLAASLGVSTVKYENSLAAANLANEALEVLKGSGLSLPDSVIVDAGVFKHFGYKPGEADAGFAPTKSGGTAIFLDPASAYWSSPDATAAREFANGWWSTGHRLHPLYHEAGHLTHYLADKENYRKLYRDAALPAGAIADTAGLVSDYAMTTPVEFVAEVFSGLLAGRIYPAPVMAWFQRFGGVAP